MARQVVVVALLFAIVGFASAQLTNHPQAAAPAANAPQAKASADAPVPNAPQAMASADAPSGSPSNAAAPAAGPTVEPGKMPDIAMPGPVGGPEKKADAPNNSGSTLFPASVVLAGAAVAGFFY